MKEFQRENQKLSQNCEGNEFISEKVQHESKLFDSRHFFDFLNNLRGENPWDERDFDLVFMYL